MDDVGEKLAALEREVLELEKQIDELGERLVNGETAVRRELNPAIARRREASSELYNLKLSLGLVRPGPQVLYGPPQSFRRANRPDGDDNE